MTYLAIPTPGRALAQRLLDDCPLESGTFCRLWSLERAGFTRYVLGAAIGSNESWVAQGADRLTPSGRRISAAVSVAEAEKCGLAFVHTHPTDPHRPRFSPIDIDTSVRLGQTFSELIDAPFASLVVSPGGWEGSLAPSSGSLLPFERIGTVGAWLSVDHTATPTEEADLDDRQIRALGGLTNHKLRSLRVAIVGAGGIGSPVAETLARMGVAEIRLIDHDVLDTPSNARRIFGVGRPDVEASLAPYKAVAVANGLNGLGLGTTITPVVGDVREPATARYLLDADVVICATDTHSSRATLAELGIRGAIPVIDTGVRVGTRLSGGLDALWIERRVQVPEGPCLWCWGRLDPERIRAELMPAKQRAELEREGYIIGGDGAPAPMVASLTVTAAGLATAALLGMLAGALDAKRLAVGLDALTMTPHTFDRDEPDPACLCARWRRG